MGIGPRTNGARGGRGRTCQFIGALAALAVAVGLLTSLTARPAAAASKHAAIVLDAKTGKVLHAANADARRYPASLTKMMTLYVVFDMLEAKRITLDSKLVVTKRAAGQTPSKLGLKRGSRITIRQAIRALITKSANDVATAVAENLAGTEAKFARYMTWRARQIGLKNTTFRNASGLTRKGQITTARDMAQLGLRLAEDHPKYFKYFKTRYYRHGKKRYKNFNSLLFNYKGTDGIKTGYTRASGFNLVSSVRKNRRHVIAVVMGGKTGRARDATMRKLLRANVKRASTRRTRPLPGVRKPVAVAAKRAPVRTANAGTRAVRKIKVRKFSGVSKATPVTRPETVPSPRVARSIASASGNTTRTGAAPRGRYHVQVGSHADADAAARQLRDVLQRARQIIEGYPPVTVPFEHKSRRWYRARFAGFSRSAARSACADLKSQKIDCIVMAAN